MCSLVCFLYIYIIFIFWDGGGGGGEGREGRARSNFLYNKYCRVLPNLAHLNNEADVTMSYLYREVPAWLFYFILFYFLGRGSSLVALYSICIYLLITYFCMFQIYFDYLLALSIVFFRRILSDCRKLSFRASSMVYCSFFPTYCRAVLPVTYICIINEISRITRFSAFICFFLVWAKAPLQRRKCRGDIFPVKKLYTILKGYIQYIQHHQIDAW